MSHEIMKRLISDLKRELNNLRPNGQDEDCRLKNQAILKIEAILNRAKEELDKI